MVSINEIKEKINLNTAQSNYKEALRLVSDFSVDDRLLLNDVIKKLYNNISVNIQKYNINNDIEKVKQLYNEVFDLIPKEEVKLRNVILNEYEIATRQIKLKSFPRLMELFLTSKCNLKCIMCGGEKEEYVISDKEFEEVLSVFQYLQYLSIKGGEVFFDKRLKRLLEEAKKTNVKLEVITNGLLLDEKIINDLVDTQTNLAISIDSVNKNIYESIRIGAKFEKLISNLELLNKIRDKKKNKISTTLHMVVMKRNYKEIEDVIKFAHKYNFNHMTIIPIQMNKTKGENFFDYDIDNSVINELAEKRDYFFNLAKEHGIFLHSRLPQKNFNHDKRKECNNKINNGIDTCSHDKKLINDGIYCFLPFKRLLVDSKVYKPRYICKNLEYINEDVENSIIKKWNSKRMMEYRKNMILRNQYNICSEDCLKNNFINSNKNSIII